MFRFTLSSLSIGAGLSSGCPLKRGATVSAKNLKLEYVIPLGEHVMKGIVWHNQIKLMLHHPMVAMLAALQDFEKNAFSPF